MKLLSRFALLICTAAISLFSFAGCDLLNLGAADSYDGQEDSSENGTDTDYESLINSITESAMLFNVKIVSEHTPTKFLGFGNKEIHTGSGVIYREENGCYYVLTNEHVVSVDGDLYRSRYFVFDAYGNEYSAELVSKDETSDLAILTFVGSEDVKLGAVTLSEANSPDETKIVSLGSPGGQMNSITFGTILDMHEVEPTEEDNKIYFPVILHTAPLEHGSSGGALLNYDLELVGVNYAIANIKETESKYSLAIPIEKVSEFLMKADEGYESVAEAESES